MIVKNIEVFKKVDLYAKQQVDELINKIINYSENHCENYEEIYDLVNCLTIQTELKKAIQKQLCRVALNSKKVN